MRSKPYLHTEFNEGSDSTLYAGGAITVVKKLAERDRVGVQLGAFGGLQIVTWVTLMSFLLCLLLFSGLLWHLAVVPAVVAPGSGLCSRHMPGAV